MNAPYLLESDLFGIGRAGTFFTAEDETAAVDHPRAARLDPYSRLALLAAQRACPGGRQRERPELGVFLGSRFGSLGANRAHAEGLTQGQRMGGGPLVFPATVPSSAASEIAIAFGAMGPNVTIVTKTALPVLRLGLEALLDGHCRAVLIGVADAWDGMLAGTSFQAKDIDGAVFLYLPEALPPDWCQAALTRLAETATPPTLSRGLAHDFLALTGTLSRP